MILLLKDLTDPGAGRFPQKTLSIPAGQQLVLSCMAQCRNDTGLQPSFRNQHIAMQTVDHIREQTFITQLGLVELAFDHNGPHRIRQ